LTSTLKPGACASSGIAENSAAQCPIIDSFRLGHATTIRLYARPVFGPHRGKGGAEMRARLKA
jgi:hypothetical protein